jgi:lipoic acid synthetase
VLKPLWVVPREAGISGGHEVRRLLRGLGLATVCESARCPNRGECFSGETATFLILGRICSRRCGFCAVEKGIPEGPDPGEVRAVAEAAHRLGLGYVVVTSVTRDDLPDGGASVFAAVIGEIRRRNPGALVEVLVPDFDGSGEALETVLRAAPEVLNHNVETVPRLYREVRPGAVYRRSLGLLRRAAAWAPEAVTKSGMMLGLGEERAEVLEVIGALAEAGCSALTLGQYLQPTRLSLPVARYLAPEEFEELAEVARELGIGQVAAGPLVRSSYRAGEMYRNCVPAAMPEGDFRNRVERG